MAKNFLVNLDLNKNQLLNAVVHNVAVDPSSGTQGQIIFNTADKLFKYHDGTKWVKIDTDVAKVTELINNALATHNQDPAKITWTGVTQEVADSIIAGLNKGEAKINKERIDGLAEAIQSASMTGQAIVDAVNGQSDKQIEATKVSGIDTIAQTKADKALEDAKAYADQVKTALLDSASTDYDTFKEIETAIKANKDALSLLAGVTKKFKAEIGDGVALEHEVTHNLGTKDVIVQLSTTVSPYDVVEADIQIKDENTVKVVTASAISDTEKIRVVVIG